MIIERTDSIVNLTFDHGNVNEVGTKELDQIEQLLETLGNVRVLITKSTKQTKKGQNIFCAGANVSERVGWTDAQVLAHVNRQRNLMKRLSQAPLFHVVFVDGLALGWGVEYLLTADYVIASSKAMFGFPEVGLGIVPGAGGTSLLAQKIGRGNAARLILTTERIDAKEALRIGLVQELGDLNRALFLAEKANFVSPTALASAKQAMIKSLENPKNAPSYEQAAYEHCVEVGEAKMGRENFENIIKGEKVPWPSLR